MGFDAAAVRHAYESLADGYGDRFGDDLERSGVDSTVLDDVVKLLTPAALVLDLGCGPAQVASYVARRGCRTVGVDLTPAMLDIARRCDPPITLINANLLQLPVRQGGADAAIAWFSLHNLPRALLDEALDEVHRVLRPGGAFVMVTHAGRGEEFVAADQAERSQQVVITYYEGNDLRTALDRHRFRVIDIRMREPLEHEHAVPKLFATAITT